MTTNTKSFEIGELREAIKEEYRVVAEKPETGFHFHTGRPLAKLLGYSDDLVAGVPESSVSSFAGTGNPFQLGELKAGEQVVDIGSGAGIDSLIAASLVGPTGHVTGIDMTDAMLAKARTAAAEIGATNVEFVEGHAEALPLDDESIDVAISNGVLNLIPGKRQAFAELFRVLKPGGRLQIADILLQKPVPEASKQVIELWTGCIAGGLLEEELEQLVSETGFVDFEITWRDDVFDGAPQESSAAAFGTNGITFRAWKPA